MIVSPNYEILETHFRPLGAPRIKKVVGKRTQRTDRGNKNNHHHSVTSKTAFRPPLLPSSRTVRQTLSYLRLDLLPVGLQLVPGLGGDADVPEEMSPMALFTVNRRVRQDDQKVKLKKNKSNETIYRVTSVLDQGHCYCCARPE